MIDDKKAKELKKEFPLLGRQIRGKDITYLDNAATTQKPKSVIDSVTGFYTEHNANVHSGIYKLSEEATEIFEDAHKAVARFLNADPSEIVLTGNTTESINLLAHSLHTSTGDRKEIILTEMEHHSNLLPWQQMAKRHGYTLKFLPVKADYTLDYAAAEKMITDKTAILSVVHVSNTLGTINDVKRLVGLAKDNGAIAIVDAAQSAPHMKIDVREIGCDFLAISGHKMLAPTGTGALYGKKEALARLEPFHVGGGTIKSVSYESAEYLPPPHRFEAGTPNIAGAAGLTAAIEYLEQVGIDNISAWEDELLVYALEKMKGLENIEIYNAGKGKSAGIISFNLKNAHAHDVVSLLDDYGVCTRGGHHCTMPLMTKLGLAGTVRASFYLYNTFEDIDILVDALEKIGEVFK